MNFDGWALIPTTDDTPRQANGFDCGVFASYCAHFLAHGAHPNFNQADIPIMRRRMMLSILETRLW